MTNSQKIHLLDQNGQAYTNLDESMRPYLKSLTPEQFEEDKNWWCTALEITGNQQSTFTIGQIVGNVISQVWDQIPALSRIKEWHKQAVDPSAACMEEANQVARYFMMVHPRQTFQYIDNNGGKKGKSARYKMVGAITEITLGSDIDWDKQKTIAWRFGKTGLCGACKNYKEFFKQICSLLKNIDEDVLFDYSDEKCVWLNPATNKPEHIWLDLSDYSDTVEYVWGTTEDYDAEKGADLLCSNMELPMDSERYFGLDYKEDNSAAIIMKAPDYDNEKAGLLFHLGTNITNNSVIQIIKDFFDIYGLSYDDLKIQFI